jgi:hypothetical protein
VALRVALDTNRYTDLCRDDPEVVLFGGKPIKILHEAD